MLFYKLENFDGFSHSLHSRRKFGECSVFHNRKLRSPPLILIAAEGWGERDICIKGVCDGQN